jgi:two-component system response regulator YesN
MLDELDLPLDFLGEAVDGEEMVKLAGQHLPDVAFVDIRMPKLSGLEAIRRGKSASPRTKWFILTGFPEFDYAKEAIQLGVSGYLLKPVNPEELSRVLEDFLVENRKQVAAQNKQFERDLMALQYSLTNLDLEGAESLLRTARFIGAIFLFDSHFAEKIKADRQFKFGRALQEHIENRSEAHNRIALIVLPSGELASIGSWMPLPNRQTEQQLRRYFQDVEQEALTFSDQDFSVTVLIGDDCSGYSSFQDQLESLRQLAPLRAVCGLGQTLHRNVLLEQAGRPGRMDLGDRILRVSRCYQDRDSLNYAKALQNLEQTLTKTGIDRSPSLKKAISAFFRRSIRCVLEMDQDLASWIEALRHHGERMLNEMPKEEISSADITQQVLKFVDENYRQDIGIGQIAEQLNITPNYLSTLFHKRTGMTFMSHLKQVRLLKAKELLSDPSLQVQQVAERVGYLSSRHFSRLFAEQFGCHPSEYRDRLKKS